MSIRPIIVAQISDLHVKPPGALAYQKVDTAAALTRCVAALNRLPAPPDLVVISGDLDKTESTTRHSLPFAKAVPGTRLIVLPGVGHMVQNAAPDLVMREIEAVMEAAVLAR